MTLSRKLKSKFVLSNNTLKPLNLDRRAMRIKEDDLFEFEVGEYVYLKLSPIKGVQRFGVKRKPAPRYVGPYKIIERSGRVAYKL